MKSTQWSARILAVVMACACSTRAQLCEIDDIGNIGSSGAWTDTAEQWSNHRVPNSTRSYVRLAQQPSPYTVLLDHDISIGYLDIASGAVLDVGSTSQSTGVHLDVGQGACESPLCAASAGSSVKDSFVALNAISTPAYDATQTILTTGVFSYNVSCADGFEVVDSSYSPPGSEFRLYCNDSGAIDTSAATCHPIDGESLCSAAVWSEANDGQWANDDNYVGGSAPSLLTAAVLPVLDGSAPYVVLVESDDAAAWSLDIEVPDSGDGVVGGFLDVADGAMLTVGDPELSNPTCSDAKCDVSTVRVPDGFELQVLSGSSSLNVETGQVELDDVRAVRFSCSEGYSSSAVAGSSLLDHTTMTVDVFCGRSGTFANFDIAAHLACTLRYIDGCPATEWASDEDGAWEDDNQWLSSHAPSKFDVAILGRSYIGTAGSAMDGAYVVTVDAASISSDSASLTDVVWEALELEIDAEEGVTLDVFSGVLSIGELLYVSDDLCGSSACDAGTDIELEDGYVAVPMSSSYVLDSRTGSVVESVAKVVSVQCDEGYYSLSDAETLQLTCSANSSFSDAEITAELLCQRVPEEGCPAAAWTSAYDGLWDNSTNWESGHVATELDAALLFPSVDSPVVSVTSGAEAYSLTVGGDAAGDAGVVLDVDGGFLDIGANALAPSLCGVHDCDWTDITGSNNLSLAWVSASNVVQSDGSVVSTAARAAEVRCAAGYFEMGAGGDGTVVMVCNNGSFSLAPPTCVHPLSAGVDFDSDGISTSMEGGGDSDSDGVADYLDSDADGDGIPDADENAGDSDSDGVPDYLDLDSDNDGIPDAVEGAGDADSDGVPDYADTDSDNDGISDAVEGTGDADSDGIANSVDTDSDGDGIDDWIEGAGDVDSDGIPDYADTDSDNDAVSDAVEGDGDRDSDSVPDYLDTDSDNDGTSDADEASNDLDSDSIPDDLDDDADGDGIDNADEGLGDADSDGISNNHDSDSDNDGILDGVEGASDADSDGIPAYLDVDSDNDGINDAQEGDGDADSDGVANFLDSDSDNDGIRDDDEGTGDADSDSVPAFLDGDSDGDCIADVEEGAEDGDSDGLPSYLDSDSDNDGISDSDEGRSDVDSDGVPAYLDNDSDGDNIVDAEEGDADSDSDSMPNYEDSDSDGDGILDGDEDAGDSDSDGVPDYLDLDSDNDGIPDAVEGAGDADSDGVPDYADTDSDNDGISDAVEGTGDADSDGIANSVDTDSDGDGIDDWIEGAGDVDSDGIPDYADTDSDNDAVSDAVEGDGDRDSDSVPDYLDTDSDNDGISDADEASNDLDSDSIPDDLDDDADGDGIDNADEGNGDADSDGISNNLDSDSDNDGISDGVENASDVDSDGIPAYLDVDSDNDGINDAQEGDGDADSDGVANFLDSDSDNDGIPDAVEGDADFDSDGIPNSGDSDSDGDGIDDSVEGTADADSDGIPNFADDGRTTDPTQTTHVPNENRTTLSTVIASTSTLRSTSLQHRDATSIGTSDASTSSTDTMITTVHLTKTPSVSNSTMPTGTLTNGKALTTRTSMSMSDGSTKVIVSTTVASTTQSTDAVRTVISAGNTSRNMTIADTVLSVTSSLSTTTLASNGNNASTKTPTASSSSPPSGTTASSVTGSDDTPMGAAMSVSASTASTSMATTPGSTKTVRTYAQANTTDAGGVETTNYSTTPVESTEDHTKASHSTSIPVATSASLQSPSTSTDKSPPTNKLSSTTSTFTFQQSFTEYSTEHLTITIPGTRDPPVNGVSTTTTQAAVTPFGPGTRTTTTSTADAARAAAAAAAQEAEQQSQIYIAIAVATVVVVVAVVVAIVVVMKKKRLQAGRVLPITTPKHGQSLPAQTTANAAVTISGPPSNLRAHKRRSRNRRRAGGDRDKPMKEENAPFKPASVAEMRGAEEFAM